VFGGMLQNITAAAERAERAGGMPLPVTRLTAALATSGTETLRCAQGFAYFTDRFEMPVA
jgi:hypothetical protein